MEAKTVKRLDEPENQNIVALAIYAAASFGCFPTFLVLIRIAFLEDYYAVSWIEILFHSINFAVAVALFREYLQDSWWVISIRLKSIAGMAAVCVAVMVSLALTIYQFIPETFLWIPAENVLPLTEADLYMTSGFVAMSNPIVGTLGLTVLCPVVTCCIYYGIGFVKAYNYRPWLGYLAVTAVAALCAFLNGLVWRDPLEQFIMFLCRLPMHLVCCWAYQKTDTIWTPIFAQAATNLIACLVSIFLF